MTSPPSSPEDAKDDFSDPSRASSSTAPPAKKRKKRDYLSCAECRRLKLKCDRTIPCANCVRRGCSELCPNQSKESEKSTASNNLKRRIELLEGFLEERGLALPPKTEEKKPSPSPSASSPHTGPRSGSISVPAGHPSLAGVTAGSERDVTGSTGTMGPPSSIDHGPTPEDLSGMHILSTLSTDFAFSTTPSSQQMFNFTTQPLPGVPASENSTGASIAMDISALDNRPGSSSRPQLHARFSTDHLPAGSGDEMSPAGDQSYGTLVIGRSGRSRYLGPTAASEWLKDQEANDPLGSPIYSRAPSPTPQSVPADTGATTGGQSGLLMFPFNSLGAQISTASMMAKLPPWDEADVMVNSYYRYFSWHFDIAPRATFQPILERAYRRSPDPEPINPQELALVFIILAMGALHNLELPPNDPSSKEYAENARICLGKGDIMMHHTIPGVQTLHVMAHFYLETEKGGNGDSTWTLWGLSMRVIQAMGLHRDGQRWNLPPEVVEERRRVFWECCSADIFQANCFSRPRSISPEYIDTAFPQDEDGLGFKTMTYQLSALSGDVLDLAMRVHAPTYDTVLGLHQRLITFEQRVPYALRCRTALTSLSSAYPDLSVAVRDSPEVTKHDMRRTFQQFTLALNISEAILFLHRPYFARALHEHVDPTWSQYGQSYLAVVERCNVIIQLATALYNLHPSIASRHWFFWYHAFNAAVCVGTLVLQNPQNPLSQFAFSQIEAAIAVYTCAVQSRASSPRMLNNLQWLHRLRQRTLKHMAEAAVGRVGDPSSGGTELGVRSDNDSDEDVELLGWRTRLISRVAGGQRTATTITPSQATSTPSPNTIINQTITQVLQQQLMAGPDAVSNVTGGASGGNGAVAGADTSTDFLLHQFWDPMMMQDLPLDEPSSVPTMRNWWNWPTEGGEST